MDNATVIKILDALNNELLINELLIRDYEFYASFNNNCWAIGIEKKNEPIFCTNLYTSTDSLHEDIKNLYETKVIGSEEVIITQVLRNLNQLATNITKMCVQLR